MAEYPWKGVLQAVAFDMDGTLLNSGDFGVRAIRLAFEQLIAQGDLPGLTAPPADSAIRAQIGKRPQEFYRDLLPASLQHRAADLHARAGALERQFLRDSAGHMFEGARDVLVALKVRGHRLLLVSNCSQDYMDAVVEAFALDELLDFRSAVGRDANRSKSGELGLGLRWLGVSCAVMVGDRHHDLEAARANNAWFIACTYGYGSADEFASADALIGDIRELPDLL